MHLSFSELINLCCVAIQVGGHSELQWVAGIAASGRGDGGIKPQGPTSFPSSGKTWT